MCGLWILIRRHFHFVRDEQNEDISTEIQRIASNRSNDGNMNWLHIIHFYMVSTYRLFRRNFVCDFLHLRCEATRTGVSRIENSLYNVYMYNVQVWNLHQFNSFIVGHSLTLTLEMICCGPSMKYIWLGCWLYWFSAVYDDTRSEHCPHLHKNTKHVLSNHS